MNAPKDNKMYFGAFEFTERTLTDKSLHIEGGWNFDVCIDGKTGFVSPDGRLFVASRRVRPPRKSPLEMLKERSQR